MKRLILKSSFVLAITWLMLGYVQPWSGSWNDGSRFAAAESLAERHTFAIDDSLFLKPTFDRPEETRPYPPKSVLNYTGTSDKLFIQGHWYSHTSPVSSLLAAAIQVVRKMWGYPTINDDPQAFIISVNRILMLGSLLTSLICILALGHVTNLPDIWSLALATVFSLGTMATAYTMYFNAHMMLMAPVAGLALICARAARKDIQRLSCPLAAIAGLLTGYGYSLDLGLGPALLLASGSTILYLDRRLVILALYGVGVVPFFALHHIVNYSIGGTFLPIGAVPEYLIWPGSPFTAESMTGGLKHSLRGFADYSYELLFGKKGFVFHNLPLWLVPCGLFPLVRLWNTPAQREWKVAWLFSTLFCGLGFCAYALTSNNSSGVCLSIRWFVPFLAPGFWILTLLLRDSPGFRRDFVALGVVSLYLGQEMRIVGAWAPTLIPEFGDIITTGAVFWLIARVVAPDRLRQVLGFIRNLKYTGVGLGSR